MSFFSELWEGVKNVADKAWDALCAIAELLFDTVFWLVDIVFSAIEAFFSWIDDMIDTIFGKTSTEDTIKNGEAGLLPPDSAVIKIIENYDKTYGTTYSRKAREKKATIGYIENSNGEILGAKIVGSDKGFDNRINTTFTGNRIYASKIVE